MKTVKYHYVPIFKKLVAFKGFFFNPVSLSVLLLGYFKMGVVLFKKNQNRKAIFISTKEASGLQMCLLSYKEHTAIRVVKLKKQAVRPSSPNFFMRALRTRMNKQTKT